MLKNIFLILFLVFFNIHSYIYANGNLNVMVADHLEPCFNEIIEEFKKTYKTEVNVKYEPSGLIFDALVNGAKNDVFVSASLKYPFMLLDKKIIKDYKVFGYDEICAISLNSSVNAENWINYLFINNMTVVTSKPLISGLGDYTWEVLENIEKENIGFFKKVTQSCNQNEKFSDILTTLNNTPNALGFIYQSKASEIKFKHNIIKIPKKFNTQVVYVICIMKSQAHPMAVEFQDYVVSSAGRKILSKYNINLCDIVSQ